MSFFRKLISCSIKRYVVKLTVSLHRGIEITQTVELIAYYVGDLVPTGLVDVRVCRLRTVDGVREIPDMDEWLEQDETHIRTGKVYYLNSTFKVFYHQYPSGSGSQLTPRTSTAIIFQLDSTGRIVNPEADDDMFRSVNVM